MLLSRQRQQWSSLVRVRSLLKYRTGVGLFQVVRLDHHKSMSASQVRRSNMSNVLLVGGQKSGQGEEVFCVRSRLAIVRAPLTGKFVSVHTRACKSYRSTHWAAHLSLRNYQNRIPQVPPRPLITPMGRLSCGSIYEPLTGLFGCCPEEANESSSCLFLSRGNFEVDSIDGLK